MNEIISTLHARKSMRVFEDKPVSVETRNAIIEAAMAAPSAGCQQMYSIIQITDQSVKDKLAKSCDNQPFIATAPLVLIFCSDMQKWYDAFLLAGAEPRLPGSGDLALAMQDTVIAAQNAVTAADSLGLGSCYIGDMLEHCEYHRELLHLPAYVLPATMLVIGYPTEQQKNRPKPPRCTVADILHENAYQPYDRQRLEALYACKTDGDFDGFMQRFCARKYNSDFSREMSRSVDKYLTAYASYLDETE